MCVKKKRLNRLSEGLLGSPVSQVPRAVLLSLVTSVLVAEMLFFASFLGLVRADVTIFNKSQNRKYVGCLVLQPFLWVTRSLLTWHPGITCLKLRYVIKYCSLNSLTSFSVLCLKLSHTTKWTWLSCWLPKLISLLFIQSSIMDETCNFKICWVLITYHGILQSVPGTFMRPSVYTPDYLICQALC